MTQVALKKLIQNFQEPHPALQVFHQLHRPPNPLIQDQYLMPQKVQAQTKALLDN